MTTPSAANTETAGKRGRKKGSTARIRQTLPADAFVIEDVEADERGAVRRQRGERSSQQVAVDSKVLTVYREWVAAGRPAKWLEMPVKRWPIEQRYLEDALFMLGKGASLHGKKLVTGHVTDKDANGRKYPDGKVRIPFCVVDRSSKDDAKNSADPQAAPPAGN